MLFKLGSLAIVVVLVATLFRGPTAKQSNPPTASPAVSAISGLPKFELEADNNNEAVAPVDSTNDDGRFTIFPTSRLHTTQY